MGLPDHPVMVEVYDKAYNRKGVVAAPNSLDATRRHNLASDAVFEVDADHPRIADLAAPGARAVISVQLDDTEPRRTELSGPLLDLSGSGPRESAIRTFGMVDDWSDVFTLVGLPNPTGTQTQQGNDGAYFTRTGPAETVAKQIIKPNAQWAQIALSVPDSLGRGSTITVSVRMHPLVDRLYPAVDQAGIGLRVIQQGATRVLECYEPRDLPLVLTEESDILASSDFQVSWPKVTRVIAGAGGEGENRAFRWFIDDARELAYGSPGKRFVRTMFVDARDIPANDPNLVTILQQRAQEQLDEGAPRASVTAKLVESDTWRYGKSFEVGDRIAIQPAGAPEPITDYVREVQFTWKADSGFTVTPFVGDWKDSPRADLVRAQYETAKGLRDLQRST